MISQKVETRVIVERVKDGKTDRKIYLIPMDNPSGFHGIAEITFQAGLSVSCAIPRETLAQENINVS